MFDAFTLLKWKVGILKAKVFQKHTIDVLWSYIIFPFEVPKKNIISELFSVTSLSVLYHNIGRYTDLRIAKFPSTAQHYYLYCSEKQERLLNQKNKALSLLQLKWMEKIYWLRSQNWARVPFSKSNFIFIPSDYVFKHEFTQSAQFYC